MDVLSQGQGPVLSDSSANAQREAFRAKPRALVDKVTTVKEAVARAIAG